MGQPFIDEVVRSHHTGIGHSADAKVDLAIWTYDRVIDLVITFAGQAGNQVFYLSVRGQAGEGVRVGEVQIAPMPACAG